MIVGVASVFVVGAVINVNVIVIISVAAIVLLVIKKSATRRLGENLWMSVLSSR